MIEYLFLLQYRIVYMHVHIQTLVSYVFTCNRSNESSNKSELASVKLRQFQSKASINTSNNVKLMEYDP